MPREPVTKSACKLHFQPLHDLIKVKRVSSIYILNFAIPNMLYLICFTSVGCMTLDLPRAWRVVKTSEEVVLLDIFFFQISDIRNMIPDIWQRLCDTRWVIYGEVGAGLGDVTTSEVVSGRYQPDTGYHTLTQNTKQGLFKHHLLRYQPYTKICSIYLSFSFKWPSFSSTINQLWPTWHLSYHKIRGLRPRLAWCT